MSKVVIISHAAKAEKELDKKARIALKKVGMTAETYAKELAPVDTGLLANSITFAIGGLPANAPNYTNNSGGSEGKYEQAAPMDGAGELTLYVGTNVYYAVYQELGHMTVNGKFVEPHAFLTPAMQGHVAEYMDIIEKELKI